MKGRCLNVLAVIIAICILLISDNASAENEWKAYETNCCTIHYSDDDHLRTFTLRIGGFKFTSEGLDQRLSLVKPRMDEIMEKVQAALDMHPPEIHIKIFLYPDFGSLDKEFRKFTLTRKTPLAFYAHKTRSIYVDVSSITDGVLAHEMAHGVINFYFKTPPPAKMQEILAQYVDLHLWD